MYPQNPILGSWLSWAQKFTPNPEFTPTWEVLEPVKFKFRNCPVPSLNDHGKMISPTEFGPLYRFLELGKVKFVTSLPKNHTRSFIRIRADAGSFGTREGEIRDERILIPYPGVF